MILSGPAKDESSARAALRDAGLNVHTETTSHLIPDCTDGTADATVAFISAEGDIDRAAEVVAPHGWVLRAHYDEPKVVSPLIFDTRS